MVFSGTARNKSYLRRIGITHVVNTAEGNRFGMVNTDAHFYRDSGIRYLGFPLLDLPSSNIREYFHAAADFIDDGIKSGGKHSANFYKLVLRHAIAVVN